MHHITITAVQQLSCPLHLLNVISSAGSVHGLDCPFGSIGSRCSSDSLPTETSSLKWSDKTLMWISLEEFLVIKIVYAWLSSVLWQTMLKQLSTNSQDRFERRGGNWIVKKVLCLLSQFLAFLSQLCIPPLVRMADLFQLLKTAIKCTSSDRRRYILESGRSAVSATITDMLVSYRFLQPSLNFPCGSGNR